MWVDGNENCLYFYEKSGSSMYTSWISRHYVTGHEAVPMHHERKLPVESVSLQPDGKFLLVLSKTPTLTEAVEKFLDECSDRICNTSCYHVASDNAVKELRSALEWEKSK